MSIFFFYFSLETHLCVYWLEGGIWKNVSLPEILLKPILFSFSLQCNWWDALERAWTVLTVIH